MWGGGEIKNDNFVLYNSLAERRPGCVSGSVLQEQQGAEDKQAIRDSLNGGDGGQRGGGGGGGGCGGGARTCGSNRGDKPPHPTPTPATHQLERASVGRTPQHAAPPISSNKPRPRPSSHPCTYITSPDWLTGDRAGSSRWSGASQRGGGGPR